MLVLKILSIVFTDILNKTGAMVCKTTATNIFILAKNFSLFGNSCPCCLRKLKTICLYIIDAVRDHTDFSSVQSLPLIINICLFLFYQ